MNIITKKFIFVRHGSSDSNIENYGLNANGKEQALAAAVNIEKYLQKTSNKIAEVISSELNRAKETAQIISEYNGNLPVSYSNNLNLRYFNDPSEEEISFNKRVYNTIFSLI
ncbi:MAG: phosphoglycerate mutase family protein [Candidatus Rickettsia vulgarisii]